MTAPHTAYDNGDGTVRVELTCVICGKPSVVDGVPAEAWVRFDHGRGEYAQVAFPMLTLGERETLISGSHEACFDAMFPDEDEDEDFSDADDLFGREERGEAG